MVRNPSATKHFRLGTLSRPLGVKLLWNQEKAAFRAGTVSGNHWDAANLGQHSIALGENVKAVGTNSIAIGKGITAGDNQVGIGFAEHSTTFPQKIEVKIGGGGFIVENEESFRTGNPGRWNAWNDPISGIDLDVPGGEPSFSSNCPREMLIMPQCPSYASSGLWPPYPTSAQFYGQLTVDEGPTGGGNLAVRNWISSHGMYVRTRIGIGADSHYIGPDGNAGFGPVNKTVFLSNAWNFDANTGMNQTLHVHAHQTDPAMTINAGTRNIGIRNANPHHPLAVLDNGLVVNENGNVGVGNANPGQRLVVGTNHFVVTSDGNVGVANANPGQRLVVGTNHFVVTSGGSVGIGVGAPTHKLVVGDGYFVVRHNGKVGVGVDNPTAKFQVGTSDFRVHENGNASIGTTVEYGRLYVDAGGDGGIVVSGAAEVNKAMFYNRINGVPNSPAVTGTRAIVVDVVNGDAFTPVFEVKGNGNTQIAGNAYVAGNLGVGTGVPAAKLHVDGDAIVTGRICSRGFRVNVNPGTCPDYVFEPNYRLIPVDSLELLVKELKHLPDVPSAKEFEESGMDVSETNLILLRKIEELTLYIIELNNRIKVLESR
jgi:hypothetical protein